MATKVSLYIDATKVLNDNGFGFNGTFLRVLADEIIRNCDPYVPMDQSILKNSAYYENGEIVYNTPYARYQYYGKLMVDPLYQKGAFFNEDYGFWSRKGVKKVLTDRDLHYSNNSTGLRGSHWVERMWADKGDSILKSLERGKW